MKTINYPIHIPYRAERLDRYCHVLSVEGGWVADALRGELPKWCPRRPVVISAPTGSGKTSFVADIVKFCQKYTTGKRVLLLVNRTAIASQQKHELARKLRSPERKIEDIAAFDFIDNLEEVGLTVMTYQRFAARYKKMNLRQYQWVVFDEMHYFYADTCFNQRLDFIFWRPPELFRHACRIYMSATPEEVLRCVYEAESDNLSRSNCCPWHCCGYDMRGKVLLYDFPKHFEQVELRYYREVDEIVNLVQSYPDDKFLIFTATRERDSIATARSYVRVLEQAGIETDYVDSARKNREVWKMICEKGEFKARVLVCTAVLDCGVTLNERNLHHIVVEATDRTEFIQMIGRKRLKANEKLNVYLRVPDQGVLYSRLTNANYDLAVLREAYKAVKSSHSDYLVHRAWNDEDEARRYCCLLNYEGNGRISPKETAFHHLKWHQATLNRILSDSKYLGDDSALPRLAHEWLEQPDAYAPSRWLDYDKKEETRKQIMTLLVEHEGIPIAANEWDEFSKKLLALVQLIKKFPHDDKRVRKPSTISSRLMEIGIPFELVAEGKGKDMVCWVRELEKEAAQNE